MWLKALHVDGYGMFRDFAFPPGEGFSRGLTAVLGANEAGKSTLLSFIRDILFGFPRRGTRNRYPPLKGGRHGGRMVLCDEDGNEYVVERHAGRRGGPVSVTLPDGSMGGDIHVSTLLGNASRDVFEAVFAFSLAELTNLKSLADESVSARIYSAGIGAGSVALPEIEKRLDGERGKLFKRRGSQEIGRLHAKIKEKADRQQELLRGLSQYDQLRRELDELSRDIERAEGDLDRARIRQAHVENLARAWADWTEYQSGIEHLRELPDVAGFPPDGIERLNDLLKEKRRLEQELLELGQDKQRAQKRLDEIRVDEALLGQAGKIETLRRGVARYESAQKDLPLREAERAAAVGDLEKSLRELGPGWNQERVTEFDTSLPVREAVRQHEAEVKASEEAFRDAQGDTKAAKRRLDELVRQRDRLKEAFDDLAAPRDNGDRGRLERKRGNARRLRSSLPHYYRLLERKRNLRAQLADQRAHRQSLETRSQEEGVTLPLWPLFPAFLLFVALGGWLLATSVVGLGVLVLIVLGAVVGGYLWLRAHLRSSSEDRTRRILEELSNVKAGVEALAVQLEETGESITRSEGSLSEIAKESGFAGIPDEGEVEELATDVEKALEDLREWEAARQRVSEAESAVVEQEGSVQQRANVEEGKRHDAENVRESWEEWLGERGLPAGVRPSTCLELLSRVESAREKLKGIRGLETRVRDVNAALEEFERTANSLFKACGRPKRTRRDFPRVVDELIDSFEKAERDAEDAKRLAEEIGRIGGKERARETSLGNTEKDIDSLLSAASVKDEEAFRKKSEAYRVREELLSVISERKKSLERIAGRGQALQSFMAELDQTTPEELELKTAQLGDNIETLDRDLREKLEQRGRDDARARGLESGEELASTQLQINALRETLATRARDWSVRTVALAFLKEATSRYERERQPAVIREAQHYFSRITEGRYPRIISVPGEKRIVVEEQDRGQKQLTELSRGTAEQLYLSLRFGYVQEFARHAEPLPVILDDVIVNFDARRARQACHAIRRLADSHQVLLFTCHPETVDLLRRETPSCRILELGEVG
jgi:uncharacterized protein YhaN